MTKLAEAYPPPDVYIDRRNYSHGHHIDGGNRPWKNITGICLHQTACVLGERPKRWDTLDAHLGVLRSGRVVHVHDFSRLVRHGNGWNAKTIGIEIDGLFEGVHGDPRTVWDDPSTPQHERGMDVTPEQIEATKQTIRWCVSEVQRHGGSVNVLVAHRQSSRDRRNDPGSQVWKEIALPMIAELGLSDGGPGFQIGGYPIPEAWDETKKGYRY